VLLVVSIEASEPVAPGRYRHVAAGVVGDLALLDRDGEQGGERRVDPA
jgi:hypothetical protein